ncbi:phage lytic cycle repressor MrpR family protein [Metabacillus sp. 22489]|uniref:phage lytic cycle repressor MrpR family protein n=1 Tax=Metabacillus sp. 22489 TaxID=3453928 RepID=UPI003F8755B3
MKNQFYNQQIKVEFLSTYPEPTQHVYSRVFIFSKEIEDIVEKDLYDFSLGQIEKVMTKLNPLTGSSARTYGRVISSYLSWCKNQRYMKGENPLKDIGNDWFSNFVDETKKIFISSNELEDMEQNLVNYQDKVILRLIFEGIGGYQLSEILNLTPNDINEKNNVLRLKDDKYGLRDVEVSDKCIENLYKASEEKVYYMKNGESKGKRSIVDLVHSEFIIKAKKVRTVGLSDGRADRHLIYRSISMISEYFDLPYLTPKNIEKSGMIKMAKDILEKEGKLENEQLATIAEKFNVRKININGYEKYNYATLREFLNETIVNMIY